MWVAQWGIVLAGVGCMGGLSVDKGLVLFSRVFST